MSKTNQNDIGNNSTGATTPPQAGARVSSLPSQGSSGGSLGGVIDRRRLQELVKEVDPLEQMDDDVEEVGDLCVLVLVVFFCVDLLKFEIYIEAWSKKTSK